MLPSGTAMSMPRTASLPSKDLTRPLASIARPPTLPSPWLVRLVAGEDVERQAKDSGRAGVEGQRARLLRIWGGACRRHAEDSRAAQCLARRRRPWRHDLDGGKCGPARLSGGIVARGPERDFA